ncbi:choloylglycine hydrolase [Kurthia sibirica]|uniref:choloylglycine hydrolase n=1 Tax=Kurthia sibirica TaxID=202750 RepID=A0A2U3ALG5_9BACL|nr:choloylglycine hydrolase [Kurthia sibirica]PWI25388.1 choloylglycine hydrolase [Kurthia sibirica]GEK34594.1 choloylglycine hydrolase [Kurthia sibirica]
MCTALTFNSSSHYFGRNLDVELSYNEEIVITPRNYPFHFRKMPSATTHFAMIGMATVVDDYPLYFDATNEKGLSMAGLNFPDNAHFFPLHDKKDNISPFEFIPYILANFATVDEARHALTTINLVDIPFNASLPLAPLHWIIADQQQAIVVESTKDGLHVFQNDIGILTNNPTFDFHRLNLSNYRQLSASNPTNSLSNKIDLPAYSRGMGAIGLPGDLSSASRFIRATFMKFNAVKPTTENLSVSQFFHLLQSVAMPMGACEISPHVYEYTLYSSCCNMDEGIYYYKLYNNSQIVAVHLFHELIDCSKIIRYPLQHQQQINHIN